MKKITTLIATLSIAATTSVAFADGGAGCGIGAEVMKGQKGKGPHIAAAIINGLIPNTFFMTTGGGLMGCDTTKAVEVEQLKKTFVASNMDQISTDAARGHGQHLVALGYLMGVESEDISSFERLTQQRYSDLFASADSPSEMLDSLNLAMRNDPALAKYVD